MVENLVDGSEYEFQVYARNNAGISESSHLARPPPRVEKREC